MPSKKLFLDITSPRRTSPQVILPEASFDIDQARVRKQIKYNLSSSLSLAMSFRCCSQQGNLVYLKIEASDTLFVCPHQVSLKVTENGSFNVYSTSQEYKFTPEGLVRKAGKDPLEDVQSSQLSYKVRNQPGVQQRKTSCNSQVYFKLQRRTTPWGSCCAVVVSSNHFTCVGQISERDVRIIRTLGRGASSVVRLCLPRLTSTA